MKKLFAILFTIFLFWIFTSEANAIYDPTSTPNNHFGMHIIDTSNLTDVTKLVNSNGGDWGYVTFVIQKGERNPKRWQDIFDQMRRSHLIPIVRIATAGVPGNENEWAEPSVDEIDGWVSFLNSLNWVIKNRYVIIGNEPNHASEGGGIVDPKGYAKYLEIFSQKLKSANNDFFVMPAGFDASATNSKGTMEESLYLSQMIENNPNAFAHIDGWVSHSYHNPNFSGPGEATGKGTVRTYDWELNYLRFLGVNKNFPVFIAETGWAHSTLTTTTNIGPKIELAFKNAWSDKRVIAITPFIFKYTDPPFDTFSWINKDGQFYDFYYNVLNLPKVSGKPIQDVKGEVLTLIFPKIATENSVYHTILFVKNEGQSIWQTDNLKATDKTNNLTIQSSFPQNIEPGQIGIFLLTGKFPAKTGAYEEEITLTSDDKVVIKYKAQATIIPNFSNLFEITDYLKTVLARKLNLR